MRTKTAVNEIRTFFSPPKGCKGLPHFDGAHIQELCPFLYMNFLIRVQNAFFNVLNKPTFGLAKIKVIRTRKGGGRGGKKLFLKSLLEC